MSYRKIMERREQFNYENEKTNLFLICFSNTLLEIDEVIFRMINKLVTEEKLDYKLNQYSIDKNVEQWIEEKETPIFKFTTKGNFFKKFNQINEYKQLQEIISYLNRLGIEIRFYEIEKEKYLNSLNTKIKKYEVADINITHLIPNLLESFKWIGYGIIFGCTTAGVLFVCGKYFSNDGVKLNVAQAIKDASISEDKKIQLFESLIKSQSK